MDTLFTLSAPGFWGELTTPTRDPVFPTLSSWSASEPECRLYRQRLRILPSRGAPFESRLHQSLATTFETCNLV